MKIFLLIFGLIAVVLCAARADYLDFPLQPFFTLTSAPHPKGFVELSILPSGAISGKITYRNHQRETISLKGKITSPIDRTLLATSFDLLLRGSGKTIRAHFSRTLVLVQTSFVVIDVFSGRSTDRMLLLRKGTRFQFSAEAGRINDVGVSFE